MEDHMAKNMAGKDSLTFNMQQTEAAKCADNAMALLHLIDIGADMEDTEDNHPDVVQKESFTESSELPEPGHSDDTQLQNDVTDTPVVPTSASDLAGEGCGIEDLPDEVLLNILQYVDLAEALRNIALTNRRFYRLCHDKTMWTSFNYVDVVWTRESFVTVFERHSAHLKSLVFSSYSLMFANLNPPFYIENAISHCTNLTHLDICNCLSMRSLAMLMYLPDLTYLNFSKCINISAGTLPYLACLTNLRHLSMSHCVQFVSCIDTVFNCLLPLKKLQVLEAERSFYMDLSYANALIQNVRLLHIAITPVYRKAPAWETFVESTSATYGDDIESVLMRYHGHYNYNYYEMYPDHHYLFFLPYPSDVELDDDSDCDIF